VTLPVAASVLGAGGVPFVSDVRVFNTSYTDVLTVTAVFRFGGQQQTFPLAPREAKAFDDICVSLFGTPNSLGAIEFTSAAAAGSLVVTSQLRSPLSDGGHVGMFIPGLPPSGAHAVSVLTGLANGDSRTNVGVYNPNEVSVTATIRLFDGPVLLGTQAVGLAAHGVTQVNNIYGVVGFGSLVRTDGYATVESDNAAAPLFTYAAEADNRSGDLILIIGAGDSVAPTGFNPPTATVTSAPSGPTGTPTPPPATLTPTPTVTPTAPALVAISLVATQFQWTFAGEGANGPQLVVKVGKSYQLQISDGDRAGTTAHGFSGIPSLGLSALSLTAGGPPKTLTLKPTAGQIGTAFFSCSESNCGTGHDNMLGTIQVVNP
jgi:heme/copper-type cytochrome/quinol oxidase subunit 2